MRSIFHTRSVFHISKKYFTHSEGMNFMAAVAASDSHATLAVAGNDYMSLLLRLRRTAKDGQNGSNPAFNEKEDRGLTPILFLAAVAGFEPTNAAVKVLCLTA